MNLFINSPAYYTTKNGIIDDIYFLCVCISKNIDIASYTNIIETIGITPIIAPKEEINWIETKKISSKYKIANISLRSDYDTFCNGDILTKQKIILDNIFSSLYVIKRKIGANFNYEQMKCDIIRILKEKIGYDFEQTV